MLASIHCPAAPRATAAPVAVTRTDPATSRRLSSARQKVHGAARWRFPALLRSTRAGRRKVFRCRAGRRATAARAGSTRTALAKSTHSSSARLSACGVTRNRSLAPPRFPRLPPRYRAAPQATAASPGITRTMAASLRRSWPPRRAALGPRRRKSLCLILTSAEPRPFWCHAHRRPTAAWPGNSTTTQMICKRSPGTARETFGALPQRSRAAQRSTRAEMRRSTRSPAGRAGNCSAGGTYRDGSDHPQALVVSEINGTWGTAQEVPGSAALNQGNNAVITSVSCAAADNCSAGGFYSRQLRPPASTHRERDRHSSPGIPEVMGWARGRQAAPTLHPRARQGAGVPIGTHRNPHG